MRLNIYIVLITGLIAAACSNDEGNSFIDTDDMEVTTSDDGVSDIPQELINATASLSTLSGTVTLGLETGDRIASSEETALVSTTYQNTFIGLINDKIVRSTTTDLEGDQLWEHAIEELPEFPVNTASTQIVIDDTNVFYNFQFTDSATGEIFYAIQVLNIDSGVLEGSEVGSELIWRMALSDNTLYYTQGPQGDETLVAVSTLSGTKESLYIGERISKLIPVDDGVIVMSWSNKVYHYNAELNLSWTFATDGANVRLGQVVDGQYIFHSRDDNIYALDIQTGRLNWSTTLPDLFITDFISSSGVIWSLTRDFNNEALLINEIEAENGNIVATSSIPIASSIIELDVLNFKDYLLLVMDEDSGTAMAQLYNYKTKTFIWENEIDIESLTALNGNFLVDDFRYTSNANN